MSVRDLIWVNVAQALRIKRQGERELDLFSANRKTMETIYLAICDCRAIAIDSNSYLRIHALKGTKAKKLNPFDVKTLPSVAIEEERKEEERRKKMTPEEIAEEEYQAFMAGKTIRR